MIWKVNTLKKVVALILYKSKLSALHGDDLIYLDSDWLKFTLLGALPVAATSNCNTAILIGETTLRRPEAKGGCHIILYIQCLIRYL